MESSTNPVGFEQLPLEVAAAIVHPGRVGKHVRLVSRRFRDCFDRGRESLKIMVFDKTWPAQGWPLMSVTSSRGGVQWRMPVSLVSLSKLKIVCYALDFPEAALRLARSTHLTRLTGLDLSCCCSDVGNEELQTAAHRALFALLQVGDGNSAKNEQVSNPLLMPAAMHLTGLRRLNLYRNCTEYSLRLAFLNILRSPLFGSLEHLDISRCYVGDENAGVLGALLAGTPRLAGLRSLNIADNNISSKGFEAMAAALSPATRASVPARAGHEQKL